MSILNPNGTLTVQHDGADIELARLSTDNRTGADRFEFPDSTLNAEHVLIMRDLGRTVSGDGLVARKGKVTNLKEYVTAAGKRRSLAISASIGTNGDLPAADIEKMYESLGNFLLRYKSALASGQYDL